MELIVVLNLHVRRTVLDSERVQDSVSVILQQSHLGVATVDDLHAEVDEVGIVHTSLIILPNDNKLMLAVARDLVNHKLSTAQVLLQENIVVHQTNAIDLSENAVEGGLALLDSLAEENIISAGRLNGLQNATQVGEISRIFVDIGRRGDGRTHDIQRSQNLVVRGDSELLNSANASSTNLK